MFQQFDSANLQSQSLRQPWNSLLDVKRYLDLSAVLQWSSGNMPDCSVRGPRFESHRGQSCLSRQPLRYTVLGTGCTPLPSLGLDLVPRSTQPSTLCGTVKWVLALGLSNNKMAMVDADGSCHFFLADSQSKSVGLVWGLAATSALSLHSSNDRVNSRNGFAMMTAP